MASILIKTSGVEITNVTIYVPDPPVAPPQPTQFPDPTGSSSSSSSSSGGQQGTSYGPDYYQNYASSLNNILNCPEGGNAGATILGGGYNSNFLNNSTSTSTNYQSGGGGGSTASSSASSSTSNSQQSNSNSQQSNSNSSSSGSSGLYAPTAASPVNTVSATRPQHSEMIEYIIGQIKAEAESTMAAWEVAYAAHELYYTAWMLCTAMRGEPILLLAPVRTLDDSEKTCAGIVTPEFLIKRFSGKVLQLITVSLTRSRIESICDEGWKLWLNWYAANKATNTGIEWLYSTAQLKLLSTNDSVNDSNLSFRDAESGMSFPAKFIDDAILTGQSSVIDRSILPTDIASLASSYTVTL